MRLPHTGIGEFCNYLPQTDHYYMPTSATGVIGLPPQSGIPTTRHSNKKCAVEEGGADTHNGIVLVCAAFVRFVDKIGELAARVNPYVDQVL